LLAHLHIHPVPIHKIKKENKFLQLY
jgi:hypothetical protein